MDTFLAYSKQNICLDFGNAELKDIRVATEKLTNKLCECVGRVNPLFEVRDVVPCGSMEEETRNWKFTGSNQEPVIEFDFLAILKSPPQSEITAIKHCHKYMQVIDEFDRLKHYNTFAAVEPENALQTESIAKFFQQDLLKTVSSLCDSSRPEGVPSDQPEVEAGEAACGPCAVTMTSGRLQLAMEDGVSSRPLKNCSLVLKWTSSARSLSAPLPDASRQKRLDHVYILVSILPSFELVKETRANIGDTDSNDVVFRIEHDSFLVPKICFNKHSTCWKVSNCRKEIRLLQSTSQGHRYMYMVVKFLSKCLFSEYHRDGSLPSTYKIKTAVLHHIQSCVSKSCDTSTCVRQLLQDLAEAYAAQTLPDFVSEFNLLAANKSESLPVQNRTWHKNRCTIVSACYRFVSEFFDSASNRQDLSLQHVIKALQFIGKTFYTAWIQTEIQPVYDVNKDDLMVKIQAELSQPSPFEDIQQDVYAGLVRQRECGGGQQHWTKSLKVWEYAAVRAMYAYHQFECPDPPGRTPGRQENILLQAQMTCDYFSWPHEDQLDWLAKLSLSDTPHDITAALGAVDMSAPGVRDRKDSLSRQERKYSLSRQDRKDTLSRQDRKDSLSSQERNNISPKV